MYPAVLSIVEFLKCQRDMASRPRCLVCKHGSHVTGILKATAVRLR